MNVKRKLPPSILHSSFLPSFLPSYLSSIALSEMAKDHFFCFADCANEEQEGRKDSTLDSSAARFDM